MFNPYYFFKELIMAIHKISDGNVNVNVKRLNRGAANTSTAEALQYNVDSRSSVNPEVNPDTPESSTPFILLPGLLVILLCMS